MLNVENLKILADIYTKGSWTQKGEYIENNGKGSLTILVKGKEINFVARSKKLLKVIVKSGHKSRKKITINKPKLYNIIKSNKLRKLTIIPEGNIEVFSFSFQ